MKLKINLILLFFILSLVSSYAQRNTIDSLKVALNNARYDSTKVRLRFEIGEEAMIFRIGYWDSLRLDAEKNKLKKYLANALNNMGYIYDNQGDIPKALDNYHKSLNIRKEIGDKKGIANSLNNIGYIYDNQGNIPKALDFYHQSLNIREEINDKLGIATCFNNIGVIYNNQENIPKALDYYKKSLKFYEEIGDKEGIAMSLNNIGAIYNKQGNIPNALEYHNKSLKIREEIGDKQGIAMSLNNIGGIYKEQGNTKKALDHYYKSLKIGEEINDKKGIASSFNNIGRIYLKQKNLLLAEEYCKHSLELAKKIGYPANVRDAAKVLYEIYKEKQNGMKALEFYEMYATMKDSINNSETQKAGVRKQMQYEFTQKEISAKAEQDKKDAVAAEEKQKEKVIRFSVSGILALVALFALFLFNKFRVIRRQKNEIELQKQLVEEKQKEILDSINYAKRIQNAILPSTRLVKEYLPDSFILYRPKDIVAGDFYWMENKDDKILFAAADCTGHGVPGAMVSVICNNGLNRSVREYGITEPGKILDRARKIVISEFEKSDEEVKDGMDISLCALQGTMLYWAGANTPLWIIRNKQIIKYKADKQPIGKYTESTSFTTHAISLQKNDTIYIFTDGYADQFGGKNGKKFKSANFKKLLLSIQDKPMQEQSDILNSEFEAWKGSLEQVDDVCVIGVRI